ncbi:MAG: hypothetical protein AAB544_03935 [Patescibacteria group bacterium]
MNRPISYAFIDAQNLNLGMREGKLEYTKKRENAEGRTTSELPRHDDSPLS